MICLQMFGNRKEEGKFEALYQRHCQLMYHVAFCILHNHEDAEDAVQQAFMTIAKNFSKIYDINCPKTRSFIVTIVERKAIDIYREKKKRQEHSFEGFWVEPAVEQSSDDTLSEFMAQLPMDYRHVLQLRYYHEYPMRKVASLMNIKLSYAYKLEQRAKAKLEAMCKEVHLL